jgi:threonine/homoserine/homoserine lactone efflux protein
VTATHKPKWSSESLALVFGFLAILLAVVVPGILMLLPFSLGVNYGILVGFLVVTGFIFWWQRYRVLMLIRRVEGRFGGEKRF